MAGTLRNDEQPPFPSPDGEPETTEAHIDRIATQGYTIIPGVLSPEKCAVLRQSLADTESLLGTTPADNDFEGRRTTRVYNLLAHGPLWQQIPVHPQVLPVVEGVLDRGCLISSLSSITIGPGETPQPIHADDMLLPIAKPHTALVCNTMWALTPFTEANGATRLVPGSHRLDNPTYGGQYETVAAVMETGSVLVWHGSLWHGGGANTTDTTRVGVAMNYCAGFIRQQENQQLGLPVDLVATFEPRLQELVGYGVYQGLIGHIDKATPARRLLSEPRAAPIGESDPV